LAAVAATGTDAVADFGGETGVGAGVGAGVGVEQVRSPA